MQGNRSNHILLVAALSLLLAGPLPASAADDQGRGRGRSPSVAARQGTPVSQGTPARERSDYRAPAFDRGYDDGYTRGLADGRGGARYDPVDSREYRRADNGYGDAHGAREAYRTNYRAGFRQGYEDGYRAGTR